jgi:hypothetical protein
LRQSGIESHGGDFPACVCRDQRPRLQQDRYSQIENQPVNGNHVDHLLVLIAHIIQWQIMGKTVSLIEPSETMYCPSARILNAGFIFSRQF